jgi:signal transduction histidine kinase
MREAGLRSDAPTRALLWRSMLALATIAALALGGQWLVQDRLARDLPDAHVINLAGRQRMLGHELGKLALQVQAAPPGERPPLRAALREVAAEWQATHRALRRGDEALGIPADHGLWIAAHLVRVEPELRAAVAASERLIAADDAAAAALAAEALLRHEARFSPTMEAIVAAYEAAAVADARRVRHIELAILGSLLLTLVLTAGLVVWPAARRIREALATLAERGRERAAILAAVPEPVLVLGRDGAPLAAPPGEAARQAVARVQALPPPQRERLLAAIAAAIATGEIQRVDGGPGTPSGGRFELRLARHDAGSVVALVRDVSEQRRQDRRMLDAVAQAQQRMGSELHDGLCQQLTGLLMLARMLAARAERGHPITVAELTPLCEHLAGCVAEARAVAQSLYPVVLSQFGLVDALEQMCAAATSLSRVRCTCRAALGGAAPPEDVTIHLFRIAQEALANAIRHGRAGEVEVALERLPGTLVLSVRDDGVGVPADLTPGRGMGIHSMMYRAQAIGGWLTVSRAEPHGTLVRCTLPLADAAPAAATAAASAA